MRIMITGGHGFLGRKLAERLLAPDRNDVERLTLVDRVDPGDGPSDRRVTTEVADVARPEVLATLLDGSVDVVYHLASVVSAGAEADFDGGYQVNLAGSLALLERCRAVGTATGRAMTVIFTSSLATYGSAAGREVDDHTAQRPESSYGTQKAAVELLLNDYHRKGYVDGRALRLPTVTVRPGAPNKAASGFASGIVREPLRGVDVTVPVRPDTVMAVISPRRVIDALATLPSVDGEAIGPDRTVLLPGLPMSMEAAKAAVEQQGPALGRPLGRIDFDPDPDIQRIIDSWPSRLTSRRAEALGFTGDGSVAAIVRQHIEDELEP